ncbi:MAG: VanZ family protein [Betaproteobacteria bacterium]|nr:VanZ family protein [Betaproteobacteria bacterium]
MPLDFKPLPFDQAWATFQLIPMYELGVESRADWISNGVLYVPVGFLTAHLLIQKFSDAWRVSLLFLGALFSFALAFGVEFTQLFFPPRTVSLNDILAECVGSLIGLILVVRYSDWFKALLHAVFSNPGWLALRLVEAYLAGYVAFSLFPFDILLSRNELEQKILGGGWGLLLADDAQGNVLVALKLIAEIILTLPFGLFLGYRAVGPSAKLKQAAWWGFGLGCCIEVAQFFTASGVSQGLSILTRILGVFGGVVLWNHRTSWSPERVAALVNRYVIPITVIYVFVLLQVNGWFTHGWKGADYAVSQLIDLHFLPFYYHYFTTEAKALFSLASVCLMYLPIGLLRWSKDGSPSQAFCYAFFASSIVEAGKLFLQDLHPDPTNLVLGALASSGVVYLARELSKATAPVQLLGAQAEQHPMPAGKQRLKGRSKADHRLPYPVMFAVLAFAAYWAATFPAQPVFLSLFLLLSAATIWSRPASLVIILPAALPLLDLAPWSGRFFFDEFDLLVIVCLAVGYVRVRQIPRKARRTETLFRIVAGLLFISFTISAIRGLTPWHMLDANTFSNYYSPFNTLRITKAALWAFLLYGLLARIVFAGHNVPKLFALGMVLGVAGTLLVVVWERITFPGLLNFNDVYRVTGPFSQMHVGGADVETYLTIGTPFLVMLLFDKSSLWLRIACALLLLVTTYGVMVTFSRVGYLGFGVAFTLALLAVIIKRSDNKPIQLFNRAAIPLMLFLAVLGVGTPIFYSQFAQERLGLISTDLTARQSHWEAALRMRDSDWATALLGMGSAGIQIFTFGAVMKRKQRLIGLEQSPKTHFSNSV